MDRIARDRIGALLLAATALAADQLSKSWAMTGLRQAGGHLKLPGPIDLTLSLNQSNAFSMTPVVGGLTRWLLTGSNLAVAAVLLWVIIKGRTRPLNTYAFGLIMAGAIGNAVDRVLFGAVVDFLDASKTGFVWIFNLADTALNLGIGLFILSMLMERRHASP